MKILVLDSGMNQTAYLLAELAGAGHQCTIAAPRLPDPRGIGRYAREIEMPPIESAALRPFVESLLSGESFDVVLPTIEPLQQLVWSLPSPLSSRVFPAASAQQQALIEDRRALYAFVEKFGVPVPRDRPIVGEADLQSALDEFGFPCVLRGTQGVAGEQVKICKDATQAQAAYRQLLALSPQPPFVQQYVDGRRSLIGGLFSKGRMLQFFSQTTIEACPAPAGPSVRVRSLRDPVLTEHARTIFEAFAWDGLACAEFIQLGRGDYRFLEINPRPWAAIQAAHYCGVPLLNDFVGFLGGRMPPPQRDFADGIECTLFPAFFTARIRSGAFPRLADLPAYLQSMRAAPWSEPPLLRSFARLIWWTYDAQRKASSAGAR